MSPITSSHMAPMTDSPSRSAARLNRPQVMSQNRSCTAIHAERTSSTRSDAAWRSPARRLRGPAFPPRSFLARRSRRRRAPPTRSSLGGPQKRQDPPLLVRDGGGRHAAVEQEAPRALDEQRVQLAALGRLVEQLADPPDAL